MSHTPSPPEPRPHYCSHPAADLSGRSGCPNWPGCVGLQMSTTPPALTEAIAAAGRGDGLARIEVLDNRRGPRRVAQALTALLVLAVILGVALGVFTFAVWLAFHLAA